MGEKRGMKALEIWCRRVTEGYPGVKIVNMTTSWRDGLAFCALIHHFRPDLIDFDRLDKRDILKNNELAFRVAERQLGIPALLDPEDMLEYEIPDRLSILTYLSQFYQAFSQQGGTSPSPRKHTTAVTDMLSTKSPNTVVKVGRGRIERCWTCERPVFLAERLVLGGKVRHRACFTCARCGHQLNPVSSYETESGDFVCEMCPDEEINKTPSGSEPTSLVKESVEDALPTAPVMPDPQSKPPDPSKMKFFSDILTSENNATLETNIVSEVNVSVIDDNAHDNSVQTVNDYENAMELALNNSVNDNDTVTPHDEAFNDKDTHITDDLDKEHPCHDSRTEIIEDKLDNIVNSSLDEISGNVTIGDNIEKTTNDNINSVDDLTSQDCENILEEPEVDKYDDNFTQSAKELIEEVKEEDATIEVVKSNRLSVKDRISALEKKNAAETDSASEKTNIAIGLAGFNVVPDAPQPSKQVEACLSPSRTDVIDIGEPKEDRMPIVDNVDVSEVVRGDVELTNTLEVADTPVKEHASIVEDVVSDSVKDDEEKNDKVSDNTNTLDFTELNRRLRAVSLGIDDENEADSHDDKNKPEEAVKVINEPVITVTFDDSQEYPKGMNPFGDSDDDDEALDEVPSPIPAVRSCKKVELNKDGKTIIEAPQHLNPFWSDDDSEEDEEEEAKKPQPAPRSLRTPEPLPRHRFGSSTSLASQTSSPGGKKMKRPAPQPPVETSLQPSSSPVSSVSSPCSHASRSPVARRRKSRPAPPPPTPVDKERKDQENKVKQNLSPVDKSMYGKWKRKKGAAPGIPIAPQKRRIIPLVPGDVAKEVIDLEVQQSELERQGVEVEQSIRRIDEGEGGGGGEEKDIEDLVLQLFEIVNKKNELFRRQAELMYLRRQQRLEEEQADLEYQIRCLMSKNKAEADPALEEELIARMLDVVERRNEIVDCLEMNRKRQIEEDQSINDRLLTFSMKDAPDSAGEESSGSSTKKSSHISVLKLLKKKKKEKKMDKSKDADADIDESVEAANDAKPAKAKKKWFTLDKHH